jgi:hypothetical protein
MPDEFDFNLPDVDAHRKPRPDPATLQAEYEQLTSEVMRLGNWLQSAESDRLTQAEWDGKFADYRRKLDRLRTLGDQLLPSRLRERAEPLAGNDEFVQQVAELYEG